MEEMHHKKYISNTIMQTIIASTATTLVVLGIVAALIWENCTRLVRAFVATEPQVATFAAAPKDLSVTDVVQKANPAVVSIEVSEQVPKYSTTFQNPFGDLFPGFSFQIPQQEQDGTQLQNVAGGSGFFVSKDGLVVTNRHVVQDTNATYTVYTTDSKKYNATVLARDPVLDIALLKVTGSNFPYLTLGNSDNLELGQSVVAIGFALGEFKNSVSVGVVSGLSRTITAGDESGNSEQLDKVIQTDAAINPGNSGGPLLNLKGEVIGVNVAVAEGSQNIGFSLPINTVLPAIQSVEKTGKIVRPYLGIRYIPVTPDLKAKNNLSVDYGILVAHGETVNDLAVIPGSPADKAGLKENDIILAIDGVKLDDSQSFASIIRTKQVGQTVSFTVLSRGITKTVSVQLEAAP